MLPADDDRGADISIAPDLSTVEAHAAEGVPWLQVERIAKGDYMLRFGSATSFIVSADGGRVRVCGPDAPLSSDVRHLLLDQVVPLVLAHRGSLVLHASAVVLDGHSLALIGPSGAGKSTLAGALACEGGAVLADDAVVVQVHAEQALAYPAYPGLRVWPDVLSMLGYGHDAPCVADGSEKRRITRAPAHAAPSLTAPNFHESRPLSRLYVLSDEQTARPRVTAVQKRAAAMAILAHAYVLDPEDLPRLCRQLDAACDVVERVAVRRLSYARDLAGLGDVRAAIARDLRA